MEFNQVLELIKVVSGSELTTFSYEEGNQKILMQTGNVNVVPAEYGTAMAEAAAVNMQGGSTDSANGGSGAYGGNSANVGSGVSVNDSADTNTGSGAAVPADQKEEGKLVKSPLVGRFYAAPSEDAEPFVKAGDAVKKGQTLAIVEAMKLMNEIESEYDGVVEEVLAQNGQSVEYGQPLFRLR